MTIENIVNLDQLNYLIDQSLFFNTMDRKRLQLKEYLETFRNYIKTPYSSYKMFKTLPLELDFYISTLDLFKEDYSTDFDIFLTIKGLATHLKNKSNEILELIENNAL